MAGPSTAPKAAKKHRGIEALKRAPIDDEPVTPEEVEAVREAMAGLARGEVVADEELERELGWE
jgi:hypothetical protein